jgi:hypothetical protein
MEQQTTEFIPTAEVIQEGNTECTIQKRLESYLEKAILAKKVEDEEVVRRSTAFANEMSILLQQVLSYYDPIVCVEDNSIEFSWRIDLSILMDKHGFGKHDKTAHKYLESWFKCNLQTLKEYKLQWAGFIPHQNKVYALYKKI